MADLNLPCRDKEEVVAELAAHLEDSAAADPHAGDFESCRFAQIQWSSLARAIELTKCEEGAMSYRSRTVLLSTIGILFSIGLVLLFLDRAAILQGLIWISCMGLLLWVAASEVSRLNQRTRSLWLPGLISLTAASLLMFAEEMVLVHDSSFYFTDISLRPSHLVSGLPRWFYFLWLLAQVVCGALGAFLSRSMGGTRASRIAAGAFPAIAMFLLCGLVIPISAVFEHNVFVFRHPSGIALGILLWAAAPGVALLVGASPFLGEPKIVEA